AVPGPVARRVPGAGGSAGRRRWDLRRGPARGRRGGGGRPRGGGGGRGRGGSKEPVDPLDGVGGTCGEGRRGTGGCGEDDQGGGEQPRIASSGGRIVGMEFHQPRYLLFSVPHQRQERED